MPQIMPIDYHERKLEGLRSNAAFIRVQIKRLEEGLKSVTEKADHLQAQITQAKANGRAKFCASQFMKECKRAKR